MRFTLVTLRSVIGFVLNSCADDASLDEVASAADSILSRTRDRSAHPAVLALSLPDGGLCTSALFGPRLLLTARHCVSETVDQIDCASRGPQVAREFDPTSIVVLAGDDARTRTVLACGERILTPRTRRLCDAGSIVEPSRGC